METAIMTGWQSPRLQQIRTSPNTAAMDAEGLRYAELSSEIPSPPLPSLKWGLGRCGSWFHPFSSLRCIACTWAPLDWPCLPTRCSITASSCNNIPTTVALGEPVWLEGMTSEKRPEKRLLLFRCWINAGGTKLAACPPRGWGLLYT